MMKAYLTGFWQLAKSIWHDCCVPLPFESTLSSMQNVFGKVKVLVSNMKYV